MNAAAPVTVAAVHAAEAYEPADDLWLVTSYFNPAGYRSKARNYESFRDPVVRGGLRLLTIECAFGSDVFSLSPAPDVVQVRARDVMWQKERLLNLAIARLPSRCAKVAWVDCDILFEDPGWAVETSRLLDRYPLVQPFATAIRLARGSRDYRGEGDVWPSFGAVHGTSPERVREGDYDRHGETGFAWAARRDVVAATGLYDACIVGGGDHVIAHAMCGDFSSRCMDRLLGLDSACLKHCFRWGEAFFEKTRGEVGHVPGAALHLWHGDRPDRRYSSRHKELGRLGFDPEVHLRIGDTGCWEWAAEEQAALRAFAADYFAGRNEDGAPKAAASGAAACHPVEVAPPADVPGARSCCA